MSAVESVGPQALPALQEQVEQIIAEAKRQGASACEVAVSLEQGLSTSVRQREVETVEFNRDQGFGITLYVGQRKGSASTSASGRRRFARPWPPPGDCQTHLRRRSSGLADAALMARTAGFRPVPRLGHHAGAGHRAGAACEAAAFDADAASRTPMAPP
jgi:PmbA protein